MKIVARDPENLKVLIDLGANGYLVTSLNQPQLNTDALNAAKKALGMLEAGKTVDDWAPLSGKDEAMAYLNYTIGVFTIKADPSTALKNLIKAAQFETPLKKSPQTYAYIGAAYEMVLMPNSPTSTPNTKGKMKRLKASWRLLTSTRLSIGWLMRTPEQLPRYRF